MKANPPRLPAKEPGELFSELLLLADGTVIAHNLTPTLAALLEALGLGGASIPSDQPATRQGRLTASRRNGRKMPPKYECSD
jgi:hypothetical protein